MTRRQILTQFLKNYLTAGSRPLPTFLIVGAQKAGTSSLFKYLDQHPSVRTSFIKEAHFFTRRYWMGERGYRALFPKLQSGEGIEVGEASPLYLFDPSVPARVARLLPEARIIALLREPVSRAYSHFQHNVRRGHESRSWEDAVQTDIAKFQAHGIEPAPGESTYSFRHHSYIRRGMYAEQIQRWLNLFPASQCLVLKAEDFFTDPALITGRAATFLNLSSWEWKTSKAFNQFSYEKTDPDPSGELAELFSHENMSLAELAGIRWSAPKSHEPL